MNILLTLKRPFIWLSRIGNRRGYGVHSPFAFELITYVIYEKTPYYAYRRLAAAQKAQSASQGKNWSKESSKVNQLLFRLVNRFQPCSVVDAGELTAASLFLQAGKINQDYQHISGVSSHFQKEKTPVDFLYLHHERNISFMEHVFELCVQRTTPQSVFVIADIHSSSAMKELWEQFRADERVGVTFDLYEVGILFFDCRKIKQHYTVNF